MRLIAATNLKCMLLSAAILCGHSQTALAGPVKAEEIYLSNAGIACPTESEFLEIVQHAERGEVTLAEQMMKGGGGDCVNFPARMKIRVLRADPHAFVGHYVIEFNPDDHPEYSGAWGSDQLLGKKLK